MNEELLIRFLTHTCLPGDIGQIDQWIASDKANANWLFEMERVWSLKNELRFSDKQEIEQAYNSFLSGIKKEESTKNAPKHFSLSSVLKYAVAMLVIGLLGANLYLHSADKTSEVNIIEVAKGQRASLTLSDGTKVWLNSQSKLTYPAQFSNKSREVRLEGEAYFDVSHNKKSPFTVQSPLIAVKVLGTKFNMRTYSYESAIVTLTSGKVEVESNNHENKLTLKPNEQVVYSPEAGMALEKGIDTDLARSWTKGEAAFINKRLDEIVLELERKFGVKIEIVDEELDAEIFTSRFKESATIQQVLTLLKETRKLNYSIENNQIRIFKPTK